MTRMASRSIEDLKVTLSLSIAASENGRHLVRSQAPNEPFFFLADTAWELPHRLSHSEAEVFFRNRSEKGFNVVMVVLLAEHGGLDYPNRNGDWPFFPHSDSKPGSYLPDLSRPNPAYFAYIDTLSSLAASFGILLAVVPTWGRYVNGGYYGSPLLFDDELAYNFGRFLGERYPFHPFILGADSVRYWNEGAMTHVKAGLDPRAIEVKDYGGVTKEMARGLIEGEDLVKTRMLREGMSGVHDYKTFITFHSSQVWLPSAPEATASAQFPEVDWLSLDVVQTGHHDSLRPLAVSEPLVESSDAQAGGVNMPMWFARSSYVPIRKMYTARTSEGKPRPVLDLEAHYENTHQWFNLEYPLWTAKDIRNGGWQAIFAGACGYTYGVNSIWQMHHQTSSSHPPIQPPTTADTDWYLELDLPGAFQVSLMRRIMLSLPKYFDRIPDQSIILSSTNEPEDGTWAGDKLISGMRSEGWAMVHLPYGGEVEVHLGLAGFTERKWRAWWIDPRCGGREVGVKGGGGDAKAFKSPTSGSLDDDWLLLIEEDKWPLSL